MAAPTADGPPLNADLDVTSPTGPLTGGAVASPAPAGPCRAQADLDSTAGVGRVCKLARKCRSRFSQGRQQTMDHIAPFPTLGGGKRPLGSTASQPARGRPGPAVKEGTDQSNENREPLHVSLNPCQSRKWASHDHRSHAQLSGRLGRLLCQHKHGTHHQTATPHSAVPGLHLGQNARKQMPRPHGRTPQPAALARGSYPTRHIGSAPLTAAWQPTPRPASVAGLAVVIPGRPGRRPPPPWLKQTLTASPALPTHGAGSGPIRSASQVVRPANPPGPTASLCSEWTRASGLTRSHGAAARKCAERI